MNRLSAFFAASAGELKNLRSLTLASLLTAIYAVSYSPFAGNIVIIPGFMEFRFGFLAIAMAAMLLGPVPGVLVALIGDFIGTIVFYGGSFFFGYPLSWALMGLMFGCILYKGKISTPRILLAMALNSLVINQVFTTLWQSMLGFGAFQPLFFARIPRTLIMFPINTVLTVLVLRSVYAVYHRIGRTAIK